MTNTGKIVTGVLIGTAVGTLLGLLFAPQKGIKTRAMIAHKAKELGDKAKELGDASAEVYSRTKDQLGFKNEKQKERAVSQNN